jgi:hypothetical protein
MKSFKEQCEIVGAYVLNFGAAEMATFQWITKFQTDLMVRDMAIDMPLGKRIALVCDLVKRSDLPADRKTRALELWGEVAALSKIRNRVAHSPMCQNPNKSDEWGIIDVKKMKGVGPYPIEPLHFDDIARDGSRLAKLLPELLKPFSTDVHNGKGSKEGATV